MIKCPLCDSSQIKEIEEISSSSLISLYRQAYGLDIKELMRSKQSQSIFYFLCNRCGLGFFHPLITGDDQFYSEFQRNEWYYVTEKPEYQYASQYINDNLYCLDVGCGVGLFSDFLPDKEKFIGLEFNEEALSKCNKKGLDVRRQTIEEYASKHPASVDMIVSFQVLEHVSTPGEFLDACSKAMNPSGKLIISVPNNDSFLGQSVNMCINCPPHHVTRWTKDVFEWWAINNGFVVEECLEDSLADIHKQSWRANEVQRSIRSFLGLKYKIIDMSFVSRVIQKISSRLARISKGNTSGHNGHSITVIMSKEE